MFGENFGENWQWYNWTIPYPEHVLGCTWRDAFISTSLATMFTLSQSSRWLALDSQLCQKQCQYSTQMVSGTEINGMNMSKYDDATVVCVIRRGWLEARDLGFGKSVYISKIYLTVNQHTGPEQMIWNFADGLFKLVFLKEIHYTLFRISLKCVGKGPIDCK